jgi:glucose-6-phosphate 1-epimerase
MALFGGSRCLVAGVVVCGTVVFSGFCGTACDGGPFVTLETAKASARIALDGARVVSFKVGGDEIVWTTRVPADPAAKWSHGGIPVCWPWFGTSGGHDENSIHGFAKSSRFELVSLSQCPERSHAILRLRSDAHTRKIWPHDFEVEYEATLSDTLRLSLRTVNTGSGTFSYTAGFHPYFRLGDRTKARVTGTDGLVFCDARVTNVLDGVWRGDLRLDASYDNVFDEKGASTSHTVVDPSLGRTIYATASGVTRLVVWAPDGDEFAVENPGPGMLGPGDWRHFACVEPAFLWDGREIVLGPGERHQFVYEISVSAQK